MNGEDFESLCLSRPQQRTLAEQSAIDAAKEYDEACEAYDRTVCSRRNEAGVAMPANPHESGLINRHARAKMAAVLSKHGVPARAFRYALDLLHRSR